MFCVTCALKRQRLYGPTKRVLLEAGAFIRHKQLLRSLLLRVWTTRTTGDQNLKKQRR
jgi:hypothetical protein